MNSKSIKILDCTLRDGGYYNNWDFSPELINDYFDAMVALDVDIIEIGLRSLKNNGFKGGCAFSTESFIAKLNPPAELIDKIAVMVNGSELLPESDSQRTDDEVLNFQQQVLGKLFKDKNESLVSLVRIACHVHEFKSCLPAAIWLKDKGYLVGFNIMQIATRSEDEIVELAKQASIYPIDVLYFADSMGSLKPSHIIKITNAINKGWSGEIGVHTHDNMGQGLANSEMAVENGVTWVDSTVTGMGRGAGNVQTEYVAIALQRYRDSKIQTTKLLEVIRKHFKPLQAQYGWGTNPYYYLAGLYGIHPSYVQEMLSDSRYSEEDVLAVIEHFKHGGGNTFSLGTLELAREFYANDVKGTWCPSTVLKGRDILILGTGSGVSKYQNEIEEFISVHKPFVIALNTQQGICEEFIDVRAACHPVRLVADCNEHIKLKQPLVTPLSMLPKELQGKLNGKDVLDFGMGVQGETFTFESSHCVLPMSLVVGYALAIATSGESQNIFLAGFDGYGADDPRRKEMDSLFTQYSNSKGALQIISITPTRYEIQIKSIYGMLG